MGSKMIAAIGLLASGAFIYFCVDTKKMEIAQACNVLSPESAVAVVKTKDHEDRNMSPESTPSLQKVATETNVNMDNETVPALQDVQKAEKSDPAFGIMFGPKINVVGMFAEEAKEKSLIEFINTFCENRECIRDIRFSNDIKNVRWYEDMVRLIQMFDEEHIQGGSLYINSNVLHIEGEITDKTQRKELDVLIDRLKKEGLFIEDETVNMMTKVEEHLPGMEEETAEESAKVTQKQPEESLEKELNKTVSIADATAESPKTAPAERVTKIYESDTKPDNRQTEVQKQQETLSEVVPEIITVSFDTAKKEILPESKARLDKLAEQLKGVDYRKLEIYGYEKSSEGAIYDMVVSQKKADLVKKYLFEKGVRHMVSKGMGAQKEHIDVEIKLIK